MKKIKALALALLLTSAFCCTAFAGTGNQKAPLSTENMALGVVYGEQEVESDINPAGIFPPTIPKIETFQVKRVRLYPAYEIPGNPGKYGYDKNTYVVNTIPGNSWGQNNILEVSPETTEKLRHSFDELGYEVKLWRMEMDCYVANYNRPLRFEFVSLDGSKTISAGAYNGTSKFELVFPVQDTTKHYSNGYKGSFEYQTTSGGVGSLMAGGYVHLNDTSAGAK